MVALLKRTPKAGLAKVHQRCCRVDWCHCSSRLWAVVLVACGGWTSGQEYRHRHSVDVREQYRCSLEKFPAAVCLKVKMEVKTGDWSFNLKLASSETSQQQLKWGRGENRLEGPQATFLNYFLKWTQWY